MERLCGRDMVIDETNGMLITVVFVVKKVLLSGLKRAKENAWCRRGK